jgi:DNA-directed RNA polymerase subunit beta'
MKVKGEGLAFYSPEEVEIAYAEGQVSLNAKVRCRLPIKEERRNRNKLKQRLVESYSTRLYLTSRIYNELLTKKSLEM